MGRKFVISNDDDKGTVNMKTISEKKLSKSVSDANYRNENPSILSNSNLLIFVSMERYATVVCSLIGGSLMICLSTAIIFQHEDVIEVECGAKNSIPSLSAITGAAPQRYFWRICIALSSGPRLVVGVLYYNWYMKKSHLISNCRPLYILLARFIYFLYLAENSCLVAVTYISNKENYPVHEKLFIGFLTAGIAYMVFTLFIWTWLRYCGQLRTTDDGRSFLWKKLFTLQISISTMGLVYYFYWHRVHCLDGAFSRFCLCEYLIALAIIFFHYTAVIDFKGSCFVNCRPQSTRKNETESSQCNNHLQNGNHHKTT